MHHQPIAATDLLEPAGDAAPDPVEGLGVGGLGPQPQPQRVRAHAAGSRTDRGDKMLVAVEFDADPSRPVCEVLTQLSEVALGPIGIDVSFRERHGGVPFGDQWSSVMLPACGRAGQRRAPFVLLALSVVTAATGNCPETAI